MNDSYNLTFTFTIDQFYTLMQAIRDSDTATRDLYAKATRDAHAPTQQACINFDAQLTALDDAIAAQMPPEGIE